MRRRGARAAAAARGAGAGARPVLLPDLDGGDARPDDDAVGDHLRAREPARAPAEGGRLRPGDARAAALGAGGAEHRAARDDTRVFGRAPVGVRE